MSHIHLIGIGGAGLSAIATVLLEQGHTVTGSDMAASPNTERLSQLGATIAVGHQANNLPLTIDQVVISSAIPTDNVELLAARQRGLNVVKRAEWLGRMMAGYRGVAIAGTHGKTTTTAMTAFLLQQADLNPTYIIGGFVPQLNGNAAAGDGSAFVIEADEYDYTFLGLQPEVAVITTIEWDHPDIFSSVQQLEQAFLEFIQQLPKNGLLICHGDDRGVRKILPQIKEHVTTYGFQPHNDWRAVEVVPNEHGGYDFKLFSQEAAKIVCAVSLRIPGLHNVANGMAALMVASYQQIKFATAAEILGRFEGVERRFQHKGTLNDITVIDDYAHHPTAVQATLSAARARYPQRRIWAIFQPHTFSRTRTLLNDFRAVFAEADHLIVVDIFAAREPDDGSISSRHLVDVVVHDHKQYIGGLAEAAHAVLEQLIEGDVVITMGAGDSYKIGELILAGLST